MATSYGPRAAASTTSGGKNGTVNDRGHFGVNDRAGGSSGGLSVHRRGMLDSAKSFVSGVSGVHLNVSGRSTHEEDVLIPRSPRPQEQQQQQQQINHYNPQNATPLIQSNNPLLNDSQNPVPAVSTNSVQSFHQRLNQNNHHNHGHSHGHSHSNKSYHLANKRSSRSKRKGGSLTPSFHSYLATSRNKNKIVAGSVNESVASELVVRFDACIQTHYFYTNSFPKNNRVVTVAIHFIFRTNQRINERLGFCSSPRSIVSKRFFACCFY